MKETLITFETAKLAKEKGFSIPKCKNIFVWEKRIGNVEATVLEFKGNYKNKTLIECDKNWQQHYMRPTQSLLQKWLREVHNIHVSIVEGFQDGKIYYEAWVNIFKNKKFEEQHFDLEMYSDKYEEALEAGLQEALKLIPIEL